MLCYDYLENDAEHSSYQDCNMYIKTLTRSLDFTYLKLTAKDSAEVKEEPNADTDTITTSKASLKYNGQSETGASTFSYTDEAKNTYDFEFNLQYYNPSDGHGHNKEASGAYLFIPDMDDQASHLYSEFSSIKVTQGQFASQFVIVYKDSTSTDVYQVIIRLKDYHLIIDSTDEKPIEFEVQMLEIPIIKQGLIKKGREVVAKWKFDNIDNEDTFYTDSNALEMQQRVIDSRPDFQLDTKGMNVTENYYPINAAIAIRDANRNVQATIMNHHSQGGGSIEKGTIELMQNRRLLHDDDKGVD